MAAWFQQQVDVRGTATLRCSSPEGIVRGPGRIVINAGLRPDVSFEVEAFEPSQDYPGMLHSFLEAELPVVKEGRITFSKGADINSGTLTFDTSDGKYVASDIVDYGGEYGVDREVVSPYTVDLTYFAAIPVRPKYCVLPLRNFATKYLPLPELRSHPLVIDASSPSGIRFEIAGTLAYIQPLDAIEPFPNDITAVLVTEMLPDVSNTWESLKEHFPFELLSALSFATGSRVSPSWIELRGSSAELVSRFHVPIRNSASEEGHVFVDFIHSGKNSGLGAFLTNLMAIPETTRHWLAVAMNLCVSATPGSSTVDDNLAFVFRAFELFVNNRGRERVDLRAQLSTGAGESLDAATQDFRQRVSTMRKTARETGQIQDDRLLERIQSRLVNIQTSDSDIGITMEDLIRSAGLEDINILDKEFMPKKFNGKTWARVISELRQATVHEGYLEFEKKHDIHATFAILSHLHDLLARLIFLECKYEGTYNPTVGKWRKRAPLNWVTPTLEVEKLGFRS